MSWPYPALPPDTRAVGTGNPPADINALIDYVTALTGRVKAGVFDPRDYGAKGDAVTDDTAAINATIAAMPVIGGVIQLHGAPQSYLISAPIVLSPNQVAIGSHLNAFSSGGGIKSDITCSAGFTGLAAIADTGALGTGGAPTPSNPVTIFGLSLDLSLVGGSTTDGIRVMSFGAWIYYCEIRGAPANGIHVTNVNAGGNATTNPLTQIRVCRNVINLSGNCGILADGTAGTASSDCYCLENIVRHSATNLTGGSFNSAGACIDIEFSSDWHISRNHVYSPPGDGIIVKGNGGNCFIDNNFVDHFGLAGAAATTYHGLYVSGATGGPAIHVGNNSVWADESFGQASTVYQYYNLTASAGGSPTINFTDNTADQVVTGPGTAVAKTFSAGSGTLSVIEAGTTLTSTAATPTLSAVNSLTGTIVLLRPGSTCLTSGTLVPVAVGLSGVYGTATTLLTPLIPGSGITLMGFQVFWGGVFAGDSCTFRVTATYDDGSTATFTQTAVTATGNASTTPAAMAALFKQGRQVVKFAGQATTSLASTTVTCTVTAVGIAA